MLIIVQALYENDFLDSMMDIFEAVDPHMGKTPLHFAVLCQNPMNSKIMLTCGIEIEARDNRGYTALHMAAKKAQFKIFS